MDKNVMQVKLEQVLFYAKHGFYPVESKTGGQFVVDLTVAYPIQTDVTNAFNELQQTVDYVSLYTLVKNRMAIETPLLETVVVDIVDLIRHTFSQVNFIEIKLTKLNPPIPGFQGNTAVQYSWEG